MRLLGMIALAFLAAGSAAGQAIGPSGLPTPNLVDSIERPMRYQPDGTDFVIVNGGEFFNRSLYGRNTAFRVDAGDVPEFLLYLPGRGGNLRLGLKGPTGTKWLHKAASITARYRPGEMHYEIRDPILGAEGVLRIAAVPMHETDGLTVRIESTRIAAGTSLYYAFGGVNSRRGRRDGDIGTENVPIAEYFQLRPEVCRDDRVELGEAGFILHGRSATILGLLPAGATRGIASSAAWDDPVALFESQRNDAVDPVVVGAFPLDGDQPHYLALQRVPTPVPVTGEELSTYREVTAPRPGAASPPAIVLHPGYAASDLPRVFEEATRHYARVRSQIAVETPDAYINAAVSALNIAADAVWDEPQQGIMHGAIAWRSRLLGWRGPYAMDALGWHERNRAHFRYWAGRQNTNPIPEKLPPPDEDTHLARSKAALHSNGDMTNSHYDMNLVAIDALFRHLRWTGDLEFAREMWPVIERHLAWERRLFRREFATAGGEVLPLYEAYAAIWASDDLQYHGGGTAHASAYNFFHHKEAARLARLLDLDPVPFEREAELIARGMREILWMPERGAFAEFKDLLGLQLVHPHAALWSIYHVIDSEVATADEALAMTRYVDARLPRLPVRGPGVPVDADYAVFASTDWMPYTWSINNVVMGENVHTALAYWQAGRAEDAFRLTKSSLLAAMFMGICPGNVGSMSYLDVYRRESQRDFADGSGVLARAMVEGLFGIQPDALAGALHVEPGFPSAWDSARIATPAVEVVFERHGTRETLTVRPRASVFSNVTGRLASHGRTLVRSSDAATADGSGRTFVFEWSGSPRSSATPTPVESRPAVHASVPARVSGKLSVVNLAPHFNDRVTEIFRFGKYRSPRSPYVSLAMPAQGIGAWAGHVNAMAVIDDSGLRASAAAGGGRFTLPNGATFTTPGPGDAPNIAFTSQWDNYPREVNVPLAGRARRVHLLMAGSTNPMQSRLDNGEVVVTYEDGTIARLGLRNPETWWPIEQDYFIDDYQFRLDGPLPMRIDLKTGAVRVLDPVAFKGRGGPVEGGAATVLALDLDPAKELRALTVRTLANEVVIGLMAATLED